MTTSAHDRPVAAFVGAGGSVPCVDGTMRPYRDLDCAASTPALATVAARVTAFLPDYASVHRGAGYRSRVSTEAYEAARRSILAFSGRHPADPTSVAIITRNTTESINHLAYRLALAPDDVVVTTVVEHHANLLPWARVATRRFVECGVDGTFSVEDVVAALDATPRPRLLAMTGASNVTGWLPPVDAVCEEAHARGIPVALDAAQLAPHRPLPTGPDFLSFSGHKLYAPFGAGALVGPRSTFSAGDPFLAGGGAVDLVDLDEVIWSEPPEREEAGSPNVVGAIAVGAALDEMSHIGWDVITAHEKALGLRLRQGLAQIERVTVLGPGPDVETLAVAPFNVAGVHHALVAARLNAEWGIGVRHGCFCAHPYLMRLLGVGREAMAEARRQVLAGNRSRIPGAVRASAGLSTTASDIDALLEGVSEIASDNPSPVAYEQDAQTGDFYPTSSEFGWTGADRPVGSPCARS